MNSAIHAIMGKQSRLITEERGAFSTFCVLHICVTGIPRVQKQVICFPIPLIFCMADNWSPGGAVARSVDWRESNFVFSVARGTEVLLVSGVVIQPDLKHI
jgi:hypothetical protein